MVIWKYEIQVQNKRIKNKKFRIPKRIEKCDIVIRCEMYVIKSKSALTGRQVAHSRLVIFAFDCIHITRTSYKTKINNLFSNKICINFIQFFCEKTMTLDAEITSP